MIKKKQKQKQQQKQTNKQKNQVNCYGKYCWKLNKTFHFT